MISCDTNILFPACDASSPDHQKARGFLGDHVNRTDFCLCEQVLMELYSLLRNPAVCAQPLSAVEAVETVQAFRGNPKWRIVDVVFDPSIMKTVWKWAAMPKCAYRRIFDFRLAATLQHHGVKHFASRNVKDFIDLGFETVWDPFTGERPSVT